MIKSKHVIKVVAVWLLILLGFAGAVGAEISPRSKGDELLRMLPAESLFCVRVNNLDRTLNTAEKFLAGVSGKPLELPRNIRQELKGILDSPELKGVNMEGNFAMFGVSQPGIAELVFGVFVPVTDYKQFLDGSPNIGQPDSDGISTTRSKRLVKQMGNYALFLSRRYDKLTTLTKSIPPRGVGSVLDSAEVQRAINEPLWMYGSVQQAQPLISGQFEQMKINMKKAGSSNQAEMVSMMKVIEMYISIFETFMKETKSLSLTVRPRAEVCNFTIGVSAVPGTEMANMLATDTTIAKDNRLLGYLEDGAWMNFAGKMNTPLWKQLNIKSIDFLTAMAGEAMTDEDITKMKAMTTDMVNAVGGPMVFSFFIDANSKPPFAIKYVLEVKDADKFNNVFEEAAEIMNTGGIADFYKSLGIEMGFTIKRDISSYRGVSIDSARLVMKSTDPNLPQGQMIDAMYGDGFDYRWAIHNKLFVCAVGGDVDSAIRKLIDESIEGGPKQMSAEMKSALTLLPDAGQADFMGTFNIPRLFKMMGAMSGAFMPVPMPFAKMDIPTRSNIVFAGDADNGRMTVDIALPKEHLIEVTTGFKPALVGAREQAQSVVSMNNMRQIALGCLLYAEDNDKILPPNLMILVEKGYIRKPEVLESPLKPKDFVGPSYIYVSGLKMQMRDASRIIISYENPAFCTDKICAAFLDGHIEAMGQAEFLERLKATYKQLGREMPDIKFEGPIRSTAP